MIRNILALCLIVLLTNPLFAQSIKIVEVTDGDIAALSEAIQEANAGPADRVTTIKVSGDFKFTADHSMPPIDAAITIRGPARFVGPGANSSSFIGDQEGPSQLFQVNSGASFRLDNLELADFSLNHRSDGLIVNEGSLHFKQVQISSISVGTWCGNMGKCTPSMPIILNRASADLRVDQVSVVNSGTVIVTIDSGGGFLSNQGHAVIANSQVYLPENNWSDLILNFGTMNVRNSSFLFDKGSSTHTPELFFTGDDATTEVRNSVISGFSGSVCHEAVSIGYNLNDAVDCEWSSEGDLVGVSAALLWRQVEANWTYSDNQILTHALVLIAASPAVNSANCTWVWANDLLNHRRPQGEGCDRGAVESWKIGLGEGGINGLYFNPEADGHYLYILETDFTTLVVWTTFDADGNQAWVYGTGQLVDGRSVIADTYINRNGGYSPDGEIMPSEAEHWGRIEVDMTSCSEGLLAFYSDLPEFGNGQFPIKRLAFVKQLGCID